jgi:membrane protein DedA with SNARE-associated domain
VKEMMMHYLSTLGVAGLFIAIFIESLGVPFPGGIMVVFAGFMVGQGRLNLYHALFSAVAAFVLGSIVAFFLGRYVGEPFFQRCGKYLNFSPRDLNQAQVRLKHSSAVFIILGRFIPGLSNVSPYLAGISRLGLGRFILYNFIFALLWGGLYLGIGIFFGHRWSYISGKLQIGLPVVAIILSLIYLGFTSIKKKLARKKL